MRRPPVPVRLQRHLFHAVGLLPAGLRQFLIRRSTPLFSVGALCAVEGPDGTVLLVRSSYRRGWGFPGGLIRRGEDPEETARRELREELGLEFDVVGGRRVVVDSSARRVDVVFRVRPRPPVQDAVVARSPEILATRWAHPEEAGDLQVETAMALEELARHRGLASS